jgi:catechol 2,3-dioxygenase-like lactoylglutathione lyase family enzyme
MDKKLEVVVMPVSDLDRAKAFYEKLGFRLDIDSARDEDHRVVQFTPPGSEAAQVREISKFPEMFGLELVRYTYQPRH